MSDPIKIDDAAGKTIARVARTWSDNQLAIVYADGTFSYLRACPNYDCDPVIEDTKPDDYEAKECGLIDDAEYKRRQDAIQAMRAIASAEAERKQYEALKAKFEATP